MNHRGRRNRPRSSTRASLVGQRHEVQCGAVGHGGFVIARTDGPVLFVRHALPGERVIAEVTEGRDGDRFLRADAVEILSASADRVAAPCRYAGPGGCGGCDFQHASLSAQRQMKRDVIVEQFRRLAKLDVDVEVEEVAPQQRWRTRMQYVDLPDGARGLRQHRSHQVVEIDDCLIDAGLSGASRFEVLGRSFEVEPDGFWQPHVAAPETLVSAVLDFAEVAAGEQVLDLYAGVGLFAAFLVDAGARVTAVEGDRAAARHARSNVAGASVHHGDVQQWLLAHDGPSDVVVLDPPRSGAKRTVIERIAGRAPRAIVYVACDPAALARDTAILAERGYRLGGLRAFDLFPMTHHVECVGLLTGSG